MFRRPSDFEASHMPDGEDPANYLRLEGNCAGNPVLPRQLSRASMFSTVFSTVVEILGKKPKGSGESGCPNAKSKSGNVAQASGIWSFV